VNTQARAHHIKRVAALHTQGESNRLLVLVRDGNAIRVESAQSFKASDMDGVRATLQRASSPPLIRVIPGEQAITRVVRMPSGTSDEILAALELIAEAELPSSIPHHRRAAGVIPSPQANGTISAMLLGWPEADPVSEITPDEHFTTETAALNALLSKHAGASAAYADKSRGSISIFASNDGGYVARSMREDPSEPARWAGTIASTGRLVGVELTEAEALDASLIIDEQIASRFLAGIKGTRSDSQWLDQYAIALGAADRKSVV